MHDHAQADDRGIRVRERAGALDDVGGSGARRRVGRVLRWDRAVLLNLPREDVWRLASDTARFNRAVGLPPITFTPREERGYGQLLAETRYFGIPLRWYEHPFNWV